MIRRVRINTGFALFLSLSVNLMYVAHAMAHTEQPQVKVAFLGVYFEGLEEKVRDKIFNDFLEMVQLESDLDVKTPSEVEQVLGKERTSRLLNDLQKDSLLYVGSVLHVDYVFAARIANESKDPNQIIIVGSYHRYDCLTGALYSYSILKFYQSFHEDLKIIKEQFVTTILPQKKSILRNWPFLVVAGLAIIGVFLLFLTKGKSAEEGDRPPEPIPT